MKMADAKPEILASKREDKMAMRFQWLSYVFRFRNTWVLMRIWTIKTRVTNLVCRRKFPNILLTRLVRYLKFSTFQGRCNCECFPTSGIEKSKMVVGKPEVFL